MPSPDPARAQDLEPKAYSASPVGAAFLVVGVARSSGSVLTDPSLPVQDIEAKIYGVPLAAGYTFGLFGKLALVTAALPYTWGDVTGQVVRKPVPSRARALPMSAPSSRSISPVIQRWVCASL